MAIARAMPWDLPHADRRAFGRVADPRPQPEGIILLCRGQDWLALRVPHFGKVRMPRRPSDRLDWYWRAFRPQLGWTRIQTNEQQGSTATPSVNWSQPTAIGSVLTARVAVSCAAATGVTLTPASGWLSADTATSATAPNAQCFLYYQLNAATSRSGAEAFPLATGTAAGWGLALSEWVGQGFVGASATLDGHAHSNGTSTNIITGTTGTLTAVGANDLGTAIVTTAPGTGTYSTQQQGYTQSHQALQSSCRYAVLQKFVVGTTTTQTGNTDSASENYAGAIAAFYAPTAPGVGLLALMGCG
jgi:hypothetical protein